MAHGSGLQTPPVHGNRVSICRWRACRRGAHARVAGSGESRRVRFPARQPLDSSMGRATVSAVCRGFDSRSKTCRLTVQLQDPPVAVCASTRHRVASAPAPDCRQGAGGAGGRQGRERALHAGGEPAATPRVLPRQSRKGGPGNSVRTGKSMTRRKDKSCCDVLW